MNNIFYKELMNELPSGYAYHRIICDEDGIPCDYVFLDINYAFEVMTGLKGSEVVGKKITEVLPDIKKEFDWIKFYGEIALNGGKQEFEQFSDPLKKWYRVHVYSPEKYYFITYFSDITKEIISLKEKITILTALNDIVFEMDRDYRFKDIIVSDDKYFMPREEIIGKTIWDLPSGALVEPFIAAFEKTLSTGKKESFTHRSPLPDDDRWFKAEVIYSEALNQRYIVSIMNISEQKKLEDELNVKTQELENFFSVNLDLLCITDIKGNFHKLNSEWENTLGYSTIELEKRNFIDFVHPNDIRFTLEAMFKLQNQEQVLNLVNRYRCKDGTYRYLEWRSKPYANFIYSAARDITEKIADHKALAKMVKTSEYFLQLYERELDYQKVTDDFLDISGAKFAMFNLYDEDGKQYSTMAIAGDKRVIKEATQILGLKIEGEMWAHDPLRLERIKDKTITRFASLKEFIGNDILKPMVGLLMNSFPIGEVVVIKILKNNIMLGDFTIFMTKGKGFSKESIAEVYTRQLGLVITQKRTDNLLRLERGRLANIIKGTNVGTWEWNVQTGETVLNERWAEIIGYTLEEISPINVETRLKFAHPEDLIKSEAQLIQIFSKEIDYYDVECRMKHKDGRWIWIQDRGRVMSWMSDGKPLLMSGTHTDITDRKSLELDLAQERHLLRTTLVSVGDGVISTDNKGNIVFLNKVAEFLTGWNSEEARGKKIEDVLNIINEYTGEKSENIVQKVIQSGKISELANHTILISKDGTERPIEDSAAPIVQENGEIIGVVVVFRDFSEKKAKQDEILYLSYHDQLTSLYNRRFYEEELKRLDTIRNLPLTIVMADVNGLKLINDSFGHVMGDELLKKAAEVIRKGCRVDDIIARIGGDEFVILLPKTDLLKAEQIIKRIKDLASTEKVGAFDISMSFGYETKSHEKETIQEIFKNAEDDMYRNKLYESLSMRNKTIGLIMNTLYEKSNREMLHSKRVSEICEAIATNMKFEQDAINQIRIAGLMHDIGKMGIDEKILNKPTGLNGDEWKEMKRHPEIGYRILSSVNEFSEMASYILEHHERWDGKGYPSALAGEEISLQARIIAVADAFDAMTSARAYSKPLSKEEAVAEIRRCAGTQFDPKLAKVFIEKVL